MGKKTKTPNLLNQLKAIDKKMAEQKLPYSKDMITDLLKITSHPTGGFGVSHTSLIKQIIDNYLSMLGRVKMSDMTVELVNIGIQFNHRLFLSQAHGTLFVPITTKITEHFLTNLENPELSDKMLSKIIESANPTKESLIFVERYLEKNLVETAKIIFDKIKKDVSRTKLNEFYNYFIMLALHNADMNLIERLTKSFEFNPKEYRFITVNNSTVSILNTVIESDSYEFKKKYLKFLSSKKIHPDSDKDDPRFSQSNG